MPPEQAAGRTDQVGPAADVYSLGAILYALLVGRPPFQAASPFDTLRQVLERDAVSPRQLNTAIPVDLDTICLKCLNKDPQRRYASAGDLAEDLQSFVADRPIRARPAGNTERVWRWCRRNPTIAVSILVVAATLIAGTSVSTWFAWKANIAAVESQRQSQLAELQTSVANDALRETEKERDKAVFLAYKSYIDQAQQTIRRGHFDKAEAILEQVYDPKMSHWEYDFLLRQTKKLRHDLRNNGWVHSVHLVLMAST